MRGPRPSRPAFRFAIFPAAVLPDGGGTVAKAGRCIVYERYDSRPGSIDISVSAVLPDGGIALMEAAGSAVRAGNDRLSCFVGVSVRPIPSRRIDFGYKHGKGCHVFINERGRKR